MVAIVSVAAYWWNKLWNPIPNLLPQQHASSLVYNGISIRNTISNSVAFRLLFISWFLSGPFCFFHSPEFCLFFTYCIAHLFPFFHQLLLFANNFVVQCLVWWSAADQSFGPLHHSVDNNKNLLIINQNRRTKTESDLFFPGHCSINPLCITYCWYSVLKCLNKCDFNDDFCLKKRWNNKIICCS